MIIIHLNFLLIAAIYCSFYSFIYSLFISFLLSFPLGFTLHLRHRRFDRSLIESREGLDYTRIGKCRCIDCRKILKACGQFFDLRWLDCSRLRLLSPSAFFQEYLRTFWEGGKGGLRRTLDYYLCYYLEEPLEGSSSLDAQSHPLLLGYSRDRCANELLEAAP